MRSPDFGIVAGLAVFVLLCASLPYMSIKDGVQLYRNPVQTMDKITKLIPGLQKEKLLDSFWEGAISDSKLGVVPVYVPNLMDSSTSQFKSVRMV